MSWNFSQNPTTASFCKTETTSQLRPGVTSFFVKTTLVISTAVPSLSASRPQASFIPSGKTSTTTPNLLAASSAPMAKSTFVISRTRGLPWPSVGRGRRRRGPRQRLFSVGRGYGEAIPCRRTFEDFSLLAPSHSRMRGKEFRCAKYPRPTAENLLRVGSELRMPK